MQDARVRIALAFVVVALVLGVLTLIFWNFVRDAIVTPIYYSLWIGGLFINSIPQAVFLVLLLLLCGGIALNALANSMGGRARTPQQGTPAALETRYHHWERLCANLYLGRFSRHLFVSESRRLILSVLSAEYRLEPRQIEALIRERQIDVPESIRKLVQGSDDLLTQPPLSRVQSMLGRLRSAPVDDPEIDALLNEIITFIEGHLEIVHVGNQPESRN
jgi:hypothetical protein